MLRLPFQSLGEQASLPSPSWPRTHYGVSNLWQSSCLCLAMCRDQGMGHHTPPGFPRSPKPFLFTASLLESEGHSPSGPSFPYGWRPSRPPQSRGGPDSRLPSKGWPPSRTRAGAVRACGAQRRQSAQPSPPGVCACGTSCAHAAQAARRADPGFLPTCQQLPAPGGVASTG